jgi:membrane protein DedA with SNARE-associated domain
MAVTFAVAGWVSDVIEAIGYLGLVLLMLVENLFPPIPSELILPFAGYEAATGEMQLVPAIGAATLGSVLGALILYAGGSTGGRAAILRWRRVLRISERDLDRAERWFDKHGWAVVLGARVVPLARSVVSVPAGTMRMGVLRFTVLTALGSGIWNTVLIGAGWTLGHNWDAISGPIGVAGKVVLALLVLALVALAVVWWRRPRPT